MPRPPVEVVALDWEDEFLPWFRDEIKPGEHGALIAPTGAGKTTFMGGLLATRNYVLAFDPKGGDSTLTGLGWPRLANWPGERKMAQMVADNDEHDRPSRYLVGPKVTRKDELPKLREVMRRALDDAYNMGGWTTYVDELQLATDPRMLGLRAQVDSWLIAARDKGLSFFSSYQSPSWVTPQASKQATWVAVSYTRDIDVVNRLAEIMGRPKAEVRGAMIGLEKYTWLIVTRDPRDPYRVTKPTYVKPKRDG